MASSKRQNKRGRSGADAAEVRIAAIVCDPSPDAEDRMRRLYAIILKLADDEPGPPAADSAAGVGDEEKG